MAGLLIEGDDLVVELSKWERLGGFTREFVVPLSAITSVQRFTNVRAQARGFRFPGTGWPGTIKLGRYRTFKTRDYVACYDDDPGYVVELDDEFWDRLVVSCDPVPELDALARQRSTT